MQKCMFSMQQQEALNVCVPGFYFQLKQKVQIC